MSVLVSDYIVDFLETQGVEHIFTVSGGGSIFLCDALARAKKIKYVCCHHEQAAGYAAEAYARIKGFGVTLVTSGPGGTNAVSACAASWLDSVPHLFISGQVFLDQTIRHRRGLRQCGVQEINIVDIVRPITKYACMVSDAAQMMTHLEIALQIAQTPRCGPVWLDIPANVQNERV